VHEIDATSNEIQASTQRHLLLLQHLFTIHSTFMVSTGNRRSTGLSNDDWKMCFAAYERGLTESTRARVRIYPPSFANRDRTSPL